MSTLAEATGEGEDKTENQTEIQKINRNLANQLRILNEIARKQNIPIIITNQVYSQFQKDLFLNIEFELIIRYLSGLIIR